LTNFVYPNNGLEQILAGSHVGSQEKEPNYIQSREHRNGQ
jgi:hypothetical protein